MGFLRFYKCLIISALLITSSCIAQNLSEHLYPYNGRLVQASNIITAGTGLVTGSGTIDINVPGEVKQVILFLNGYLTDGPDLLIT